MSESGEGTKNRRRVGGCGIIISNVSFSFGQNNIQTNNLKKYIDITEPSGVRRMEQENRQSKS